MVKTITAEELSYLLYKVTIATRRSFSDDEGSLWLDLLDGESYDACYEAFNEYLKSGNKEYLQPSLILNIIKRKRKERIQAKLGAITPPNGVDGSDYLKWLQTAVDRAGQPPTAPRPSNAPQLSQSSPTLSIEA